MSGRLRAWTAGLLLAVFPGATLAQAANQPAPQSTPDAHAAANSRPQAAAETKEPRSSDRQKATKLYLTASKLFVKAQFEEAMRDYTEAAKLDPTNANYGRAAEVARSHAVTALIQAAAKARLLGDDGTARADLKSALEIDPQNATATQHLYELGDDALRGQPQSLYGKTGAELGDVVVLSPSPALHSFHVHSDALQIIRQVFQAYGITAMLDDSVRNAPARLDVDDASFEEVMRILALITDTFYVPLDEHRALVAHDTRDLRERYTRQELETLYLPGLRDPGGSGNELTEVGNLARNVFNVQQIGTDPSANTITLRAPSTTLAAFNSTMRTLLDGRNQVVLDVRMIQVAHTSMRNTGVQPPQTITAFNVFAEEQSLLSQNASLVQQIISSGLASPGDTLGILAILLASGQVSSSIFQNGIALLGGGLTASGLSPAPATINLNLDTSDSRELDAVQLRLEDDDTGTIKEGEKYPIQTSSYSSLSPTLPNIPGLTGAGSSSSLSSLLGSISNAVPNIPMVQYQDLGLTLKATPKVMRNDNVALTLDLSLDGLSGSSINGNPILTNQSYSGVTTLKAGEAAVVATELSKSLSRAISGTPGLSEIPGLSNATESNIQSNYATLIIVITPHVVRTTQQAGHTRMLIVDKSSTTH
jgi:general secretion pathway protein D